MKHVRPTAAQRDRALERGAPGGDLVRVPQRPVLVLEQHQLLAGEPRLAPRVMDLHKRQQPMYLRLVRHQRGEHTDQPDRLAGQVDAARVALVVDQVHDRQHRGQAVGQQMLRGDGERNPGRFDLRLRAR